jgi:hypothetical protein
LKNVQNCFDNPSSVAQSLVVPKPDYLPAPAFEPGSSLFVYGIVRMLTAIDFDNQSMLGAGEVDNEFADRMLSPELVTRQTPIAQSRPHPPLGVG